MNVWVCPFFESGLPDGGCDGPFERHHVVPRQTVKGQYSYWHGLMEDVRRAKGMPDRLPSLEVALADRRNLIPLCQRHHELVTGRRVYVTRDMLPVGIDDFAQETGLVWYLQRYFFREDAA